MHLKLPLCIESWRSFPHDGWIFNNEKILPPNAFMDEYEWIVSLRSVYPERIEKVLRIINKEKRGSLNHAWLVRYVACKLTAKLNREYT